MFAYTLVMFIYLAPPARHHEEHIINFTTRARCEAEGRRRMDYLDTLKGDGVVLGYKMMCVEQTQYIPK